VKLHRHIYGEAVENLAGGYYDGGEFISRRFGSSRTAAICLSTPTS